MSFTMPLFSYVSFPSFLLSWFLNMTLASAWYAQPVFGRKCTILAHGSRKQHTLNVAGLIASAGGSAMAFPFLAFLLSVADCQTAFEGALWGLFIGLFNAGLNCSHGLFEDRPFELFAIHAAFHLLSLTIIGGVLALFCAGGAA